ncbi:MULTISPECIES: recombinase family protein [Streptomyces]|uniref:recombinase family protein n=1 Tax=Streptomyces TaxID=1883 RepID=UPI000D28AE2B|nr:MULTISPECIES: recombinase family protein [Streptomyces]MDG5809161.1 recombinase family protein [Streptomyces ossamyceticus]SPF07458.1 hypothetical protein SMA5143A_8320 [Streptomyces sp. MA5143a]
MLVIDDDLGKSGARSEHREGFQRLVAEISLGHVGLALGTEMSRLARSGRDWYQLLELSALGGALLADDAQLLAEAPEPAPHWRPRRVRSCPARSGHGAGKDEPRVSRPRGWSRRPPRPELPPSRRPRPSGPVRVPGPPATPRPESMADCGGRLQRQPGLTDTARPGERQEPRGAEEATDLGSIAPSADESGQAARAGSPSLRPQRSPVSRSPLSFPPVRKRHLSGGRQPWPHRRLCHE